MRLISRRAFGANTLAFAGATLGAEPSGAAPSPGQPPRMLTSAEQLADIGVFRSGFLDLDRAYAPAARAQAELRLSALQAANQPKTVAEFMVALCQIAALADNGHSVCFYPRGPDMTLRFGLVAGEFHVLGAPPGQEDVLGARLVGVDGQPMASIRSRLRSLFGGIPAHRDLRGTDVLSRPDYLKALGVVSTAYAATYLLSRSSGEMIERRLAPSTHDATWAALPRPGRAPWALQDPSEPFRWRDAPGVNAVIVQLRRNFDAPTRRIADFLAETEAVRQRLGRRHVVLDMRENGGGDFLTTRDFMIAWPSRVAPPGRFLVLTGPATFSAAIASVAYLKQAGGDRVTLIGEPPGDRMMFFAEGRMARLPSTGGDVSPATQRDDFQTGCRGYEDCFAAVAQPGAPTGTPEDLRAIIDAQFGRRPLAVAHLDPDVPAAWTIAHYEAGVDPAMEAAMMRLREAV